jgi:uncharacterized RDD family membrane protein YckC
VKLTRNISFALWAAGLAVMYSYSHYQVTNPNIRDLWFMGGALLLIASGIGTASTWTSFSSQGTSSLSLTYAGIWFRLVAALMDFLFGGAAIALVARVLVDIVRLTGLASPHQSAAGSGSLYLVTFLLGYWLYYAGMESSPLEATIGKIALRLRVTDLDGRRISFSCATLRYLGKLVSMATVLIGFLVAIFTRRKQALHDLFANTLVVDA